MSLGRYAEACFRPSRTSAAATLTTRENIVTHQAIPIPHPGLPLPAASLHGLHDLSAPGFDPSELFRQRCQRAGIICGPAELRDAADE